MVDEVRRSRSKRSGPHHAQKLRLTGDDGERVVELMRDARQVLPHGRALLNLQALPRALADTLPRGPDSYPAAPGEGSACEAGS